MFRRVLLKPKHASVFMTKRHFGPFDMTDFLVDVVAPSIVTASVVGVILNMRYKVARPNEYIVKTGTK